MMISPVTYYELNLKDKSADEILSHIQQLKAEIRALKERVEESVNMEIVAPDPLTQISCNRECLACAIEAYKKAGGVYILSPEEHIAAGVDANILNIKKIIYSISVPSSPRQVNILTIGSRYVHLNTMVDGEPPLDPLCRLKCDKQEFLEAFHSLYVGEWSKHYTCDHSDGTTWALTIYFGKGHSTISISGDGAYPYNFSELENLMTLEDMI